MPTVPDLRFDRFYRYAELTRALKRLSTAAPERARLESLGQTPERRDVWMLAVTDFAAGAPEEKPGYLVHGNIHASEVSGTTAALFLAHRLAGAEEPEIARLLAEVVFYIVPRLNPDGAETALTTGGPVRSRAVPLPLPNALRPTDVDGDGLILQMRLRTEQGDVKPDEQDPRLMVPREAHDTGGPFYRVFTEGLIENWDGGEPRDATYQRDFNRNWGAHWRPEHQQGGAGDFPFSEPEMRAAAQFVAAHPNIFGALGFHNGSSSLLRPPATRPDSEVNDRDLRLMKELGQKGEEITGLKMRAVTDYRLEGSKPLRLQGHFTDWAYEHLGIYPFEIELGTLMQSAGITTEQYFASRSDEERREFSRATLRWHDAHPGARAFIEWHPFTHPQLGPVEIGGWRSPFASNPDPNDLSDLSDRCARFILEHAGRYPHLRLADVAVDAVGGNVHRVRATVMNTGGFPTYVAETGREVRANRPPLARLEPGEGVEVLSRESAVETGHLGAFSGRSQLEWFVRGHGDVRLVVRSAKAGMVEQRLRIG
ncbi:MAG: carboxypeptidase [Armatimonadetes bacterium]|nr:carboxypeptidase [Armatimonadota bacterium]